MTREQFEGLKIGDVVRSNFDNQTYIVTANYGERITAVASADLTNPHEWTLVEFPRRRNPPRK